jgi:hypothetical protein
MALSNSVALFIVITIAATLNAHGVTDIETLWPAAETLRPCQGLILEPPASRHRSGPSDGDYDAAYTAKGHHEGVCTAAHSRYSQLARAAVMAVTVVELAVASFV